ncbi:hypothetical protein F5B20DRAFT_347992 [Whalleya microplaca]|nr:hypothetical protein F5B20DRAFT_347992 [Whalleya microplaca]
MNYGPRTTAAAAASGQGGGGIGGADTFTPEMRDRQARGKDPYESSDSSDWTGGPLRYQAGGGKDEPFSILERRRIAAQVLDSPELLMMAAQRDNQVSSSFILSSPFPSLSSTPPPFLAPTHSLTSPLPPNPSITSPDQTKPHLTKAPQPQSIPATRLRYQRMLCGFAEPPPAPTRKKSHPGYPRAGSSGGRRKESGR